MIFHSSRYNDFFLAAKMQFSWRHSSIMLLCVIRRHTVRVRARFRMVFKDPLLTMILCDAKGDFRVTPLSYFSIGAQRIMVSSGSLRVGWG